MPEWVDSPDEHVEATAEDAAIASIARRLNPDERALFLGAVSRVRKEAGKGQIRMRDPNADEKLILEAYERYEFSPKATAEALGIDVVRVLSVTRRFDVRPIEMRKPEFRNPSEHLLRFIRHMYSEGRSMQDMGVAIQEILHLPSKPNYYTVKSLCQKAGVDLTRPKFDIRLYPELIADFDAIGEKYGFAVGTLHQHYMRAKKAQKGLPT